MKIKDVRDVKNDYGYILHWINGGGDDNGNWHEYVFYLENVKTEDRIYINDYEKVYNQKALDLINSMSLKKFRNCINVYDNYIKLFDLMGIKKRV